MQKKKRVYIIHGWEATPENHWFPWLKKELEARDFEAHVLAMPDTIHPTLDRWFSHVQKEVGKVDEHTYFVGHSLGVITILRFIESLPTDKKVGGAVLVAGFAETVGYDELKSFTAEPLDFEKIRHVAGKFVAIHSDNDPVVPFAQGELFQKKLGAKLVVIPNGGHFNIDDGFTKFPAALDSVLEIAGDIPPHQ